MNYKGTDNLIDTPGHVPQKYRDPLREGALLIVDAVQSIQAQTIK